jgi:hypothetical protein
VIAQTSWRLFATGYQVLAAKFGPASLVGMEIGTEATGSKVGIVGDDEPRWMSCVVCGKRAEFAPQSAPRAQPMEPMWWLREHFEQEHPGDPRGEAAGVKRCAGGPEGRRLHTWIPVPPDAPFVAQAMCSTCGELAFGAAPASA